MTHVVAIATNLQDLNSSMDELIPNLRDERVQGAVKNLLVYSIVILLVPLGSMFVLKRYMFEDLFGYTPDEALTYSAVVAVVLVHIVLCFWLFAANKDQKKEI